MEKISDLFSRRRFMLRCGFVLGGTAMGAIDANGAVGVQGTGRNGWIGFTELQTNREGGRHANMITMRAAIVRADGRQHRRLGREFSRKPNTWTQFAGWSPNGDQAILGNGWESQENGAWEEAQKTFRFQKEGWLYDTLLFDLRTGKTTNVTAVERVSFYNTGVFFGRSSRIDWGFKR